jgi:hypothetical protein
MAKFRYLGMTVINQNLILEEIKGRLNSGNDYYHSAQNLVSSHQLSQNIKIRIYKTIILLLVLYGCEIWSLTLRERDRLRAFENRMLRIFEPKWDEMLILLGWRKLHNEELRNLYSLPRTVNMKSRSMRWTGHVTCMGGRGIHIVFWWESQKDRTTSKNFCRW